MKLQISPFEKALHQLRTSLDFLSSTAAKNDPALYAQFRAASIQAFEYSYELSIKMMRRQMAQVLASPQDLSQFTFADLMRSAADAGLISDVKRFLLYRDARNRTSHTYEEDAAQEVASVIPDFFNDATFLVEQLRKRNT